MSCAEDPALACDNDELCDYDEGPLNSSGIKQVLPLGLPELGLNFSWLDHGHFAVRTALDICHHNWIRCLMN